MRRESLTTTRAREQELSRIRLGALALGAALLVAACTGGDDEETPDASDPTTAATEAMTETPTEAATESPTAEPTEEATATATEAGGGGGEGGGGDIESTVIANFALPSITVAAGTTVEWTNQDDVPHTATADEGAFDSGTLNTGDSYEFTFDEPGTFSYFCEVHPNMTGTITVE